MAKSTTIEILLTIPFSDNLLEKLQDVSPKLKITIQDASTADDIPPEKWAQVEVLYTNGLLPELPQAPNLRWVQSHWDDMSFIFHSSLVEKADLVLTTMSGAVSSTVAEYAVMMVLSMGHGLPELIGMQENTEWPEDSKSRFSPPCEIRGSTVGIVGYGSVGREIARLLYPFGVTILATKRDAMNPRDSGYVSEGLGDPEGNYFHRLYPIQALSSMLKECDFVIVTLPYTDMTSGIIGKEELDVMKPTAYLINIGKGGIVQEDALLSALQENIIAGAVLDVFESEPLIPESPFWNLPNVIVTPHIAGATSQYNDRAMELFMINLKRYLSGAPVFNRFDIKRGY